MNNIYKVIWSKAKNCYVVASEIARSHTKSATGSEKIGGVTRRSLLASLMALSLLCGGLGVASAADGTVSVEESTATTGTAVVYTQEGTESYVEQALTNYDTKTQVDDKIDAKIEALTTTGAVATNKDNITTLHGKTTGLSDDGKSLTNMNSVETDALKVTRNISDGNVTTTLAEIDASMTQTKTNKEDIVNLKATTGKQDTAIKDLQKKTTNISYADGAGTSIDGITVKDGNIVGNGHSAITQLANVETDQINGKSLAGTTVATATEVETETLAREEADNKLEEKINEEKTAREGKDNELKGEITKNSENIATLDGKIKTNADNIKANADAIAATNKRTAGIDRIDAKKETTIEGNVTVDSLGNVTAQGKLKGEVVDAGDVNAGSLNVENASHLKGDVTMDNNLTVRGDTTLKGTKVDGKLAVTDDADLKNTKVDGTLITTGEATFQKAVEMDKGLTVTGDTKLKATTVDGKLTAGDADLKNTTVGGTLGVTGATTLSGELKAEKDATFEKNVTVEKDLTVDGKLNVGEIYLEHKKLEPTGKDYDSATSIKADGISNRAKVTDENGNTTESKFTHNEKGTFNYAKDKKFTGEWKGATSNVTADGVSNKMTDSAGNKHTYSQTATESKEQLVNGDKSNFEKKTAEGNTISIKDKDADGNLKSLTNKQTVDGEKTSVTNNESSSTINQGADQIRHNVTSAGKESSIEVKADGITNTSKDGTITNDAKDIVNNATGNMTNTVGGDLTTTVGGNELHEVTGTKTENVTGMVKENYSNGQETNVTGNQDIYVSENQTNTIDGNQVNTIGGDQTTTVTGDISNKAENITNEASNSITDKVGDHTRVLDSDGITDTVGGSTFKQRIDKIMMESKNVSIKAEETLTNEAKVITNKASEVINNEAVNINNTATGIITSKASKIKNQADKLISNKVGENTWENMENGKITTSIKDGAKQNLTQSDAAGTTQSTVDGGKSTVTIQNADGLADAVTDGTNTSVQNQTASAIAAAVKDGAGNENASVANATTSVNTIKSGSKANTVISTADGTSFINSEAAAPVGDGTEVKTTIKGNTITTGKVTMDYAEVMKDIGVRGNANIAGKTTTGSLEVKGESKLTGDVTMESNATVKKDLTVEGNTNLKNTKVDGTLDVTQKATFGDSVSIAKDLSVDGNATIKGDVTAKSYKVGDKTYISAAGINANDQKITNVADGSISEGSKDAVNGGQLYTVKNDLEGKVNKVGANAAAMANLHPMEFDPSSKWNIAAAIGNYGSETAAALGAFYRPNDDVMVNLSTAFGTGENMVGGGVSVRLGKGGNKLSREETNVLKAQVADLTARMDALLSVLNPNMSKDFPDVPENHWAYEAVSRLAGNDIVQGYPDGEFHGERTMTRYEMAEIIYNALSRGAEAEKELVEEFKPELQAMAASEKATAEKAEG